MIEPFPRRELSTVPIQRWLLGHRSRALTLGTYDRVSASTDGGTASAMEDKVGWFSPALV